MGAYTFSDQLDVSLDYVAASAVVTPVTCGTFNLIAVPETIQFTGNALANPGDTCKLEVTLKGVQSTQGASVLNQATLTGAANLAAPAPFEVKAPTFTKAFSGTPLGGIPSISINGNTNLTFTITNNTQTQITPGFSDPLPAGITVNPGFTTPQCGGTVSKTTSMGIDTLSLVGSTLLGVGNMCTVVVSVNATVATTPPGAALNNQAFGTQDLAGLNPPASLHVLRPQFEKTFTSATIPVNGTTTMVLKVKNTTLSALSGLQISDTIPTGMRVESMDLNGCGFSSITPMLPANAGQTILATGGSVAAGIENPMSPGSIVSADCELRFTVRGVSGGQIQNTATLSGGPITLFGFNTLDVLAPQFTKSVNSPTVISGLNSTFTITVNNNTALTFTDLRYSDLLPAGWDLLEASINAVGCGPATTGPGEQFSIPAFSLTPGGVCIVTFDAKSPNVAVATPFTNTATGQGTLQGLNPFANVTVLPPPFTKVFPPGPVMINVPFLLTFVVRNDTNLAHPTGASFVDNFPANMEYVSTVSNTCTSGPAGVLTDNTVAMLALVPGATSVKWDRATPLPANSSCTITLNVKVTILGPYTNDAFGGGAIVNINPRAQVTAGDVSFTKAFNPANVTYPANTTLKFTIDNTLGADITTGYGFTDDLGTLGLSVIAFPPPGDPSLCGGTLTVSPAHVITYTNATTLLAGAMCMFSVQVNTVTSGLGKLNTAIGTGALLTKNPTATLNVADGPITFTKLFNPNPITVGSTTNLTFTINNQSGHVLTSANFTDTLVAGLSVVGAISNTCGGVLQATPGGNFISLSGATNVANLSSCTIVISVLASTIGPKPNQATGLGDLINKNPQDTLQVLNRQFTKRFTPASAIYTPGMTVTLTWEITNTNTSGPNVTAGFNDPLPTALSDPLLPLTVAGPMVVSSISPSCGAASFSPALAVGATAVNLINASIAPLATCIVTVTIAVPGPGLYRNIATGTGYINNVPAQADLDIVPMPRNAYQLRYFSNLDGGDSLINLSNDGSSSTAMFDNFTQNGNICVNVYTYSPDEQLMNCCSCMVTPNGLNSISVREDLLSNTITPWLQTSVVVKLVASTATTTCNPAAVTPLTLRDGLQSWASTLHKTPVVGGTVPGTYSMTETKFRSADLVQAELNRMTQLCALIQANGSGYGICKSCRLGGLGAKAR